MGEASVEAERRQRTCVKDGWHMVQNAEKENNPRGINRHKFSLEEAEEAAQQPVVQALFDLCRFRNQHPAFNGKVTTDHQCVWPSLV